MIKKLVTLLLCATCVCMLFGCEDKKIPEKETEKTEVVTFAKNTKLDIFEEIPAIDMEQYSIVHEDNYGDGWYVLELKSQVSAGYDEFESYVKVLESAGFEKYADNGKDGIDNAMYSATLTRENTVVSLTYITSTATMYIAAAEDKPLSPHLHYDKAYVAENISGAKTTLTMHGLKDCGNCYVIQLKNGHYIINDGGYQENTKMLIQSLIDNAPNGEKPVIEAWFVSHGHGDHAGPFNLMRVYGKQIVVEGIYYNDVPQSVKSMVSAYDTTYMNTVLTAPHYCRTSTGEKTPIYRIHAGERYYINDISVEVLYTCEQVKESDYTGDLNASCTWLMYNIEGQKFLLNGDTELVNMRHVATYFDRSYFNVELMSVPHHGYNLFTDDYSFYKAKTLLYSQPYFINNGWWSSERKTGNLEMQKYCDEMICWADGSKRLTFPYTVGSVETIPCWYPELVSGWTQNQAKWAAELGIYWTPAKITN